MQRLATLIPVLAFTVLAAPGAHAQWTTGSLSSARQGMSATSAAGKAFFAGGRIGNVLQNRVDIYDQGSNTWSFDDLSVPRTLSSAASLGNLAFFGGGNSAGGPTAVVEVYDAQSGVWVAPGTLSVARFGLSAATVGNKVIFACGATGFPGPSAVYSNVVDIYDSTLGAPSDPAAWSTTTVPSGVARANMGVAVCGNKAIFAGGHDATTSLANVDIYDDIGGTWSTSTLPAPQIFIGSSVGVGDHAYFCGGKTGTVSTQVVTGLVQILDATNGTWTTTSLSQPRWSAGVAAVGNTLLVGGGSPNAGGGTSSVVDVLNTLTGTWLPTTSLSQPRTDHSATSLGTQALFAGGYSNVPAVSDVVDIYDGLVSVPFCFGDGAGTACPCGSGTAGNGCPNSVNANGAHLAASGLARTAADTLVLTGTGMPNSSALYIQGTAQAGAGAGVAFGDGLRCAGGSVIRLGTKVNSAGASGFPQAGDPSISVRGLVTSPGIRTYQVWYRNAASFCTTATFNFTNGLSVTWTP